MRTYTPLLIVVSALYLLLGTFLLSQWFGNSDVTTNAVPNFSVHDSEFSTSPAPPFSFLPNGSAVTLPETTAKTFQDIATYLANHPERHLTLTGNYSTDETNSTDFENLGLARANAVKAQLIEMGAIGENIHTTGMASAISRADRELIYGGVEFLFGSGTVGAEGKDDKPAFSLSEGLVLQYTGNTLDIEMTDEIQAFMDQALNYIRNNQGAKLYVVAHTDNQGDPARNMNISDRVSKKVRRFFRNNGFGSAQVQAVAKGDTEPIASNYDAEGRTKNRRVILRVE